MPFRTNKFHAVKARIDGHVFDSQAEARRYGELTLLARAGEIVGLEIHPRFNLVVNDVHVGHYKPDFSYQQARLGDALSDLVVEDVKSAPTLTEASALRMRLFSAIYGIPVTIIGSAARPRSFGKKPRKRKAA
jgi:hypothetical protein